MDDQDFNVRTLKSNKELQLYVDPDMRGRRRGRDDDDRPLGLNPFEHSRAKMTEAVSSLLKPLNAQTEPMDLMALLIGVAQNGDPAQAKRMLDLIMNGVLHDAPARTAPPAPAPR